MRALLLAHYAVHAAEHCRRLQHCWVLLQGLLHSLHPSCSPAPPAAGPAQGDSLAGSAGAARQVRCMPSPMVAGWLLMLPSFFTAPSRWSRCRLTLCRGTPSPAVELKILTGDAVAVACKVCSELGMPVRSAITGGHAW